MPFHLALIASRFNEEICEGLLQGAVKAWEEVGLTKKQMDVFRVPGAFEIPVVAKQCLKMKKYAGVACLGAVIRGDTPHFEYICEAVTQGLMRASLDFGKPVGFGVITTNNLDQARERSRDNEYNKGREAALAVLEMVGVLGEVK